MHILLNILLFLLTLSTSVFCHAQSSELHVTVVWDSFGRGSRLFPVGIFDIELSSEDYSYKDKYNTNLRDKAFLRQHHDP